MDKPQECKWDKGRHRARGGDRNDHPIEQENLREREEEQLSVPLLGKATSKDWVTSWSIHLLVSALSRLRCQGGSWKLVDDALRSFRNDARARTLRDMGWGQNLWSRRKKEVKRQNGSMPRISSPGIALAWCTFPAASHYLAWWQRFYSWGRRIMWTLFWLWMVSYLRARWLSTGLEFSDKALRLFTRKRILSIFHLVPWRVGNFEYLVGGDCSSTRRQTMSVHSLQDPHGLVSSTELYIEHLSSPDALYLVNVWR